LKFLKGYNQLLAETIRLAALMTNEAHLTQALQPGLFVPARVLEHPFSIQVLQLLSVPPVMKQTPTPSGTRIYIAADAAGNFH